MKTIQSGNIGRLKTRMTITKISENQVILDAIFMKVQYVMYSIGLDLELKHI